MACLVAMITRRIGLSYTVGLVLAGIGLAFLPLGADLPLSGELVFKVSLPPLIFEAALQLRWERFRKELPLTLVLAFLGVVISGAAVAVGMHWFLQWSWMGAAFFGVLIAATDPVSVIAAFKEMKAEPRLGMVVESESLLNDGVAAVGFAILLAVSLGSAFTPSAALGSLLWTTCGGIGIGVGVAWLVLIIAGRTRDYLVEVTLTTVVAWGAFFAAEHFHASGVFATLSAGLLIGNFGRRGSISPEGQHQVLNFWEYAAFLANSCLFILIGNHEVRQPLAALGGAVALAIALTLIGRAIAVYPLAAIFSRTKLRLPWTYQHVLVWGGLRGAVGLALALAVPSHVPEQRAIIVITFGVVAFSIFAQGLTMPPLLRRWGLTGSDESDH